MNIGIDIDNTITETTEVIMAYARLYGEQHHLNTVPDYRHYYLEDALGWPREVADDFLNSSLLDIYRDVQPKPGAVKMVEKLSRFHNLILITSRNRFFPGIETATRAWLTRYGVAYKKLVMNTTANMHHFSKVQDCLDNQVDIMIEDHHELALELSHYVPVILFNYPYNQHIHSPNICRVNTWEEVELRIQGFQESSQTRSLA